MVNKKDQKTLIKGLIIGLIAGAVLPDNINPVEMIKAKFFNRGV